MNGELIQTTPGVCVCEGQGRCTACDADPMVRGRGRLNATRRLDATANADCRAIELLMFEVKRLRGDTT